MHTPCGNTHTHTLTRPEGDGTGRKNETSQLTGTSLPLAFFLIYQSHRTTFCRGSCQPIMGGRRPGEAWLCVRHDSCHGAGALDFILIALTSGLRSERAREGRVEAERQTTSRAAWPLNWGVVVRP